MECRECENLKHDLDRAMARDLAHLNPWRAIESAPKDGQEIVLFDHVCGTAAVGHWMADVDWANKGKLAGEDLLTPRWFPLHSPTHWMPLPPSPHIIDREI